METENMNEISKRYVEDDAFREVADLLFGGGSEIQKSNPSGSDLSTSARQKKRERTQAKVGLASNAVGLAAGVAGTASALRDDRFSEKSGGGRIAQRLHRLGQAIPDPISGKKGKAGAALAGGALGLQVANIGGDVVANRVLSRSAKDPKKVKKNIAEIPESAQNPSKGKLTRAVAMKASDKVIAANKGKSPGILTKLPDLPLTRKGQKIKKSAEFDVRWEGEFSKVNNDKQQVFGWASIVEMNGEPVVDLQGDYISIEEVEKSAYEYVHKSRKGGDMHLRDGEQPVHASDMIESFVVTPEKKAALGLPDDTPTGWWVGYQVNDPEVWAKVKNGERTGFSIHGRGIRSPA